MKMTRYLHREIELFEDIYHVSSHLVYRARVQKDHEVSKDMIDKDLEVWWLEKKVLPIFFPNCKK